MGVLLIGFVAISGLAYLHRDMELQHLAREAQRAPAATESAGRRSRRIKGEVDCEANDLTRGPCPQWSKTS
jgi:hypothetical protein